MRQTNASELPRFLRAYEPHQVIFSQGSPGDAMYVVQEGGVEIRRQQNGESVILSHLEKGAFFGEIALVDQGPRSATAIAGADGAKVLAIDSTHFVYLVSQQPSFALIVLQEVVARLRSSQEQAR